MSESTSLPVRWITVPLGELGTWYGGGTPSKSNADFWSGNIPWVSPKDMKVPLITDTEDHITREAVENSATKLLPSGAILIVTRSGILEHSLPVALSTIPAAINQDLKALIVNPAFEPRFLIYALRKSEQSILDNCSKAGTTVASIDFDRLNPPYSSPEGETTWEIG